MGGVCSGLGTYFNVEPSFIRLAFLAPDSADSAIGHHHARRGTLRFLRDSLLCFFPALFPAVVLHPDGTNPAPKARNAG
ncbi:MAG: PspC domain-containing protein [Alistipes indistinctus]